MAIANAKNAKNRLAEMRIKGIMGKFFFQCSELNELGFDFDLVESQVASSSLNEVLELGIPGVLHNLFTSIRKIKLNASGDWDVVRL